MVDAPLTDNLIQQHKSLWMESCFPNSTLMIQFMSMDALIRKTSSEFSQNFPMHCEKFSNEVH